MNPDLTNAEEVERAVDPPRPAKKWTVGTLTYGVGGLAALFLWLLFGDFALAARERSVGPLCQWYLDTLGVSAVLFGLIFSSFPSLIGLILVPVISVKSDRHRGKCGRRIPFLLVTTPLVALGVIGLGLTPMVTHWLSVMTADGHAVGSWLIVVLGGTTLGDWLLAALHNEKTLAVLAFTVFWTLYEFSSIASGAVFRGLINDVVPAAVLGRFYGLFRAISLIDGMIFNYWILGGVSTYFTVIMLVVGVLYGFSFLLLCLKVKEGNYPEPKAPVENSRAAGRAGWTKEVKLYFRECFSNPYYVMIFLMTTTVASSFVAVNVFFLPYSRSLGVSMDTYGKCLATTYVVSLALSYVLGALSDRFHPMRTSIAMLIGCTGVTALGCLFASTAAAFLVILVLHGIFCGSYLTTSASLAQRLLPRSRFAQFASAAHGMGAVAQMILAPSVGFLIASAGRNYRYTFVVAFVLSLVGLYFSLCVYRRFRDLGGPNAYVAPE